MVRWLFPPKELRRKVARREKYAEFSDATPPVVLTRQALHLPISPYISACLRMSPYISPVVLTRQVIDAAIGHLSRVDPKLEALIARIGAASLEMNIGTPKPPTQAAYLPRSPQISPDLPRSPQISPDLPRSPQISPDLISLCLPMSPHISRCASARPSRTQARLFDKCLKSITFTMVSVEAGNAFLRRLAMKVGEP